MLYHSIEKGLALPHFRPGFGKDKVRMLLAELRCPVSPATKHPLAVSALAALDQYYEAMLPGAGAGRVKIPPLKMCAEFWATRMVTLSLEGLYPLGELVPAVRNGEGLKRLPGGAIVSVNSRHGKFLPGSSKRPCTWLRPLPLFATGSRGASTLS